MFSLSASSSILASSSGEGPGVTGDAESACAPCAPAATGLPIEAAVPFGFPDTAIVARELSLILTAPVLPSTCRLPCGLCIDTLPFASTAMLPLSLCMETIGAAEFAVAVCEFSAERLGPVLEEFRGNTALLGSACVPTCRGMYTPPATSTLTPMSAPIASHKPLRDVAEGIDGGGTAPAGGCGADTGIVGT